MISVRGLSFRFPGSAGYALRDVDLEIRRGEFVVVAGPSGCGKSTLALALGGYLFHQFDGEAGGTVCVGGLDARTSPVYDLAEAVGLVQQNPEAQFCTLTVRDELAFGLENRRLPPHEIRARMAWALEIVGIGHLAQRDLATLSGGEQQKVAVAAMMAAKPEVLIFDEPTSNLDPSATAEIFRVIARIRGKAEVTVIVIEHKLDYLRAFSPRLITMDAGRIAGDGPMAAQATEGGRPDRSSETCQVSCAQTAWGEPAVRVRDLCYAYGPDPVLRGVSLDVRPGEFVAVMGDNGSGKTTLMQCLLGLLKPCSGQVHVLGCDTRHTPVSALARQVGYVFQNPDHQLFADSVWQEATFAPRNLGMLDEAATARATQLLADCGLESRRDEHPHRLSYGQKRRLNLASVLSTAPRLILLDEVLIGQDARNAAFVMDLLWAQVCRGCAVIMVTHDPQTALAYATRIVFLSRGQVLVDAAPEAALRRLEALQQTAYLPAVENPSRGAEASALRPQSPLVEDSAPHEGAGQAEGPGTRSPVASGHAGRGLRLRIAYQAGDSFLHRLHPLLKAAWLLAVTVAVFAVRSPWAVLAVLALLALACLAAKVRLGRVRGLRLFVSTALFLALLQLAFVREGQALVRIGPLAPTGLGLAAAVYVAGRFLAVVLASYTFVLTTDPGRLVYALVRAGLPYRYGFALITALRLVPVFEREAQVVYSAQLARGVRYDVPSPRRLLDLARQFLLPLLVSALGKVDALAVSMEGRAFGKHATRTFLDEAHLSCEDALALALLVMGLVAAVVVGMS